MDMTYERTMEIKYTEKELTDMQILLDPSGEFKNPPETTKEY